MDFNDYQEIVRLKSRYFRYIDTKQYDRLLELFAPDAKFEGLWAVAPNPAEFVAALTRNLPEGTVSVHQGYMPDFDEIAPGRVRGVWSMYDYLTWPKDTKAYLGESVEGQRGIHGYGHYEEEYQKTDTGWKITFLRLSRIRIDLSLATSRQHQTILLSDYCLNSLTKQAINRQRGCVGDHISESYQVVTLVRMADTSPLFWAFSQIS